MINGRPTTGSVAVRSGGESGENPPKRPVALWVAAGVASAVLIGAVAAAVVLTSHSSSSSSAPSVKMINELPDQCSLISPGTLATVAPGAVCLAQAFVGQQVSLSPAWTVDSKDPISIKVTVTRTSDPVKMYQDAKSAVSQFNSAHDIDPQLSTSLPVGTEAEVFGGRSRLTPASFEARAIGYLSNGAVAVVTFGSSADTSTAVAGAKACLSDILGGLR